MAKLRGIELYLTTPFAGINNVILIHGGFRIS
jgi:hypothetical protein